MQESYSCLQYLHSIMEKETTVSHMLFGCWDKQDPLGKCAIIKYNVTELQEAHAFGLSSFSWAWDAIRNAKPRQRPKRTLITLSRSPFPSRDVVAPPSIHGLDKSIFSFHQPIPHSTSAVYVQHPCPTQIKAESNEEM